MEVSERIVLCIKMAWWCSLFEEIIFTNQKRNYLHSYDTHTRDQNELDAYTSPRGFMAYLGHLGIYS